MSYDNRPGRPSTGNVIAGVFLILVALALILTGGGCTVAIFMFGGLSDTSMLPMLLIFIMRLINNRELMGAHVNRPLANFIGWSTVVGVSLLDVIFLASTVWPR